MVPNRVDRNHLFLLPRGLFRRASAPIAYADNVQMYNALGGLGGSGQVDTSGAANANVALLSTNAVFALFVVGPIFSILGPRLSWFLGGWTYALYSGSLLCYNRELEPP